MVKRVIEIFTDSGEDNIYASLFYKPEETIFFVDKDDYDCVPRLEHTIRYLKERLPQTVFTYQLLDFSNVLNIDDKMVSLLKDSIVDVSGGEDRVVFPLIKWALKNNVQCTYIDMENQIMFNLSDDKKLIEPLVWNRLSIEDIVYLAGGVLKVGFYEESPKNTNDTKKLIQYALKNMEKWNTFSNYFAYIYSNFGNHNQVRNANMNVQGATVLKKNKVNLIRETLRDLVSMGVIDGLHIKNNNLNFNLKKMDLVPYITKAGDMLEMHIYFRILESGYFDEVKLSSKIEWAMKDFSEFNIPLLNEIDIIARRKAQLFFISCKSGNVEREHIDEIVLLAQRFGIDKTFPMIATTTNMHDNYLLERSAMMGCIIIDGIDIKNNRIMQKFYEISK